MSTGGLLRVILTSYIQKDADKALLQIVAENKDSKLKWEGWSHEGKNGLVEILEMMVKLRVKKASSKSRSESAS